LEIFGNSVRRKISFILLFTHTRAVKISVFYFYNEIYVTHQLALDIWMPPWPTAMEMTSRGIIVVLEFFEETES
jgi:hypothetical protein